MQHQYRWSTAEPTFGHSSELYYPSGYQLDTNRDFVPGPWRSPVESEKPLWTELPQSLQTIVHTDYSGPILLSPEPLSFTLKQEYDSGLDCKWSPSLTESSLTSTTPSLSTLRSMPSTQCAAHMTGAEDSNLWPTRYQHHNENPGWEVAPPTHWPIVKTQGSEHKPSRSSRKRRHSPERHQPLSRHPEEEVQALLDRPRRVKTTAENARFYCNACDKGFQLTCSNMRSRGKRFNAPTMDATRALTGRPILVVMSVVYTCICENTNASYAGRSSQEKTRLSDISKVAAPKGQKWIETGPAI
ncbi:hypothetical protein AUEXF2481DRAFT_24585 [Aureobasidium subglaciale EXF-2481]|uniref:Uncharacterized protein n=1 Tax=Aureobasidium subglaciale (strain EXF-2481) TaxID=1043005 RepID=A0A074YR58_AURSE|nr:uncharacterized protein AUEXF2481DRAFT_24585 [Aureobasidium subglaciale EXF-2481]KER00239.1 hypothetical protein AUEXF2481DRAFT_24585 [Aureobasidium subglaciale EXF-2481]